MRALRSWWPEPSPRVAVCDRPLSSLMARVAIWLYHRRTRVSQHAIAPPSSGEVNLVRNTRRSEPSTRGEASLSSVAHARLRPQSRGKITHDAESIR